MSFFHDAKNVQDYIKMCEGYDGRWLIEKLKKHLPEGSSLLELGMGPGTDLDILRETYKVTGSDYSQVFLQLYREKHPRADLLMLDAVTLNTDRQFDCIYSNKVLQHLSRDEFKQSITRQKDLLSEEGILFHSLWHGSKEEEMEGLLFVYYTEDEVSAIVDGDYEILEMVRYKEMEDDDSFYIILKPLHR